MKKQLGNINLPLYEFQGQPRTREKQPMSQFTAEINAPLPLNDLLDQALLPLYTTDMNGRITYYNRPAERFWGRTPKIGVDFWHMSMQLLNEKGKPLPVKAWPLARLLKSGGDSNKQQILVKTPQGIRELQVFPKIFTDSEGRPLGVQNTLVDISSDQNNEIRQAHLSAIVESSDDAIIGKDLQGRITSWNSAAEKIFKYTEEEVLGKHISLLIPDSRLGDEDQIMERIKNGEKVDHYETLRVDKYGREIPISLTVSPIKNRSGQVLGASKVARDISERLLGEEKHAVLSAIVQSSSDAIVSKDLNGIISSWNAGAERIFGYTEAEAIGKHITILIPKKRLQEEDLILSKIRSGQRIEHFQTIRKDKFGRHFPVSLSVSPVKDSQENIIGASKIARDISLQVQAQAKIEHYARNLEILNSLEKSISKKLDLKGILKQVVEATTALTGAALGAFIYQGSPGEKEQLLFSFSGEGKENFNRNLIQQWLTELNKRIPEGQTVRAPILPGDPLFDGRPEDLVQVALFRTP